ncbi:reverse transcriptase domain-containing protein [Tanacetum coccineum]
MWNTLTRFVLISNSNNDDEYKALLAGLRIATKMQVKDIHAFVDSKLVASQVEGSYEAKGERMIKYQEKLLELAGAFNRFRITHIPRAENKKADALSKLAAIQFDHLSKEVPVEVLNERSVKATLMEKNGNYTMEDEVLSRKSYLVPLMRCVGLLQANYVIREVHMGLCGMHDGPRQVVAKAIIVATDYFTKWMEAKPLATITSKQVVNFTWDNIICRFGISYTIITDNGTQFGNRAVERANRSLLRGIKTRLEKGGSTWDEEVPNVLWEYQTMKKTNNGETPFSLTYGASPKLKPVGGTERNSSYKGGQVQITGREVLQQKGKLGPTWEEPYKVIQAFQSRAYKLSNIEGKRYLGPGMLVTFEGATCKAPEYLYFYYVSLSEKQFLKYKLAPKVLARRLQPRSCFGRTGPYWFNRPGPNATSADAGGACISLDICLANDKLAINSGVASPLATRKVHVHGRLKTISTLTVCSGRANALVQYYGALITIQFLVNCQPSMDLRSLYQSRLLWTSQSLCLLDMVD